MEKVYIVKGNSPEELGYNLIATMRPQVSGSVLIKPNLTQPVEPWSGIVTHPLFCEGLIRWLQEQSDVTRIAIGEGVGYNLSMDEYFRRCRYATVAERTGVELLDFHAGGKETSKLPILSGKVLKKIEVTPYFIEFDIVISAPVLKTHGLSITSLGMKNLMGLILPFDKKCVIHEAFNHIAKGARGRTLTEQEFNRAAQDFAVRLCDFVSALAPKPQLTLIDGFLGREGNGFFDGRTKRMGLAVGGTNVVATDVVGSFLMGFEVEKVPYLREAVGRDLGPEFSDIEAVREDPRKLREKFEVLTSKDLTLL